MKYQRIAGIQRDGGPMAARRRQVGVVATRFTDSRPSQNVAPD